MLDAISRIYTSAKDLSVLTFARQIITRTQDGSELIMFIYLTFVFLIATYEPRINWQLYRQFIGVQPIRSVMEKNPLPIRIIVYGWKRWTIPLFYREEISISIRSFYNFFCVILRILPPVMCLVDYNISQRRIYIIGCKIKLWTEFSTNRNFRTNRKKTPDHVRIKNFTYNTLIAPEIARFSRNTGNKN